MIRRLSLLLCATTGAILLSGCEAALSVDLTVEPGDTAKAVALQVESVQLRTADGTTTLASSTAAASLFNLISYSNGDRINLSSDNGDGDVSYSGVRPLFDMEGAYVELQNGNRIALELASQADYTDIDLRLSDDDSATLVLGMDLRFSLYDLRSTLGVFRLKPVMRAANIDDAGSISGTVARTLLSASACQAGRTLGKGVAVYAFTGADRTPSDYYASDTVTRINQPLTSATVTYDSSSDRYRYEIPFLAPGRYTLALTCMADQENPGADDDLVFSGARSVTLAALGELTSDFE